LAIDGDLTFEANPDRVRRLFENLFRNAIDHGSTDVTVTVGKLSDQPGFYVADDGPGIPPAERSDAFEAGYTTSEAGTGFGLAIVAEIVAAHRWDIHVTESEDGGARFEITGVTIVE
jgi:signal transduction histidine kinase